MDIPIYPTLAYLIMPPLFSIQNWYFRTNPYISFFKADYIFFKPSLSDTIPTKNRRTHNYVYLFSSRLLEKYDLCASTNIYINKHPDRQKQILPVVTDALLGWALLIPKHRNRFSQCDS